MKIRTLIIATALVSSLLGGVAVYLALTVPNDIRAAALLKEARQQLSEGDEKSARERLTQVIQQYPRTDAAASATVALLAVGDSQRSRLEAKIAASEKLDGEQTAAIVALKKSITELSSRPVPAPVVAKPAPAPAPKPTIKKSTKPTRRAPARRRPTRRRR